MPSVDKIMSFQELDAEISKLRELLQELGMKRANEIESGAALAGLGDLA
jgi:hypothetical protein